MRKIRLVGASVFALVIGSACAEQSTTVTDSSEGSTNTIFPGGPESTRWSHH
jgi:hypothetical protein